MAAGRCCRRLRLVACRRRLAKIPALWLMRLWNSLKLKSKDPAIRCKAIEDCADVVDDDKAFQSVVGGLGDEDSQVRAMAVKVAAHFKHERSSELIAPLLRDPSAQVRAAAATAFATLCDSRFIGHLVSALRDPSTEARGAAALALRSLRWMAANDEQQALFEVALGNTQAAAFKGEAAVNPLLSELGNETETIRRAAAEALGGVEDPRRVAPLLAAITDKEPNVRVSAIHALGKATGDDVRAALLRALQDPESHVRLAAAIVLGKGENLDLVPYFVPLLADTYFEVRLTAVQFLGRVKAENCVEGLVARLQDKDSDVRLAAAKALGEIGSLAAIEGLVLALIDEERAVRHAADLSLNLIEPDWTNSEAARRACISLEASLSKRSAWVRGAATQVIARIRALPPTSEPTIGGLNMAGS